MEQIPGKQGDGRRRQGPRHRQLHCQVPFPAVDFPRRPECKHSGSKTGKSRGESLKASGELWAIGSLLTKPCQHVDPAVTSNGRNMLENALETVSLRLGEQMP